MNISKMTKKIAYIFIIWSINICSAQKNKIELEFFQDVILTANDSLIFSEESFGWEKMKENLNRKNYHDYNLNNSFKLTDSEYKYIIGEIEANKNYIWSSSSFANSEKISENEMESYLRTKNKAFYLEFENSIKSNDSSAIIKMKNKICFAYTFSKPIFFRNNKFCFFSFYSTVGDKSRDYCQIGFYRKRNGKWIEWVEIYNNLY